MMFTNGPTPARLRMYAKGYAYQLEVRQKAHPTASAARLRAKARAAEVRAIRERIMAQKAAVAEARLRARALEPRWHAVAARVAAKHGMTIAIFQGEQRAKGISRARQECYWELWQLGLSYCRIGRLLKKDHSTILHGVERHQQRLDESQGRA